MFRRPARSAGSAAKTATAATISAERERAACAGWKALGVGVASRLDIGSSSSGAIAVPGDQAEQAGGERERDVLGDQQSDDAARREPDRLQQADLAPLGEHAAADHGCDGEADGEQRQQRVDADDDRVRPRLVGDRVADLVPVGEAAGACRGSARCAASLKAPVASGSPSRMPSARACRRGRSRPRCAHTIPGRQRGIGRLLGRDGEAGDAQVDRAALAPSASVSPTRRPDVAGEAALHAAPRRRSVGRRPVGHLRDVDGGVGARAASRGRRRRPRR